jgi:Uma2 family endonuclease
MVALRAPALDLDADHIVCLHDVTWADYERILRIRGEHSAPRISYLRGELEIMSPGRSHESIKSTIGALVEAYCLENDIEFETVGSWTLKDRPSERGAEPDECYIFGEPRHATRPHLAIEVEWTSGRIDKLEIYRKLGVREILYWRDGSIEVFALHGANYRRAARSKALPGIDLAQIAGLLDRTTSRAIRAYRATFRRRTK